MEYDIYYSIVCNTGKLRSINQDNFWCCNKYLKAKNKGLKSKKYGKIASGQNPAFAVFDGMGGKQYGEIAAHIAAKSFDKLYRSFNKSNIKNFLADSCKKINDNIAGYAEKKYSGSIGTTAAMLVFGEKQVFACNVGDSKIYRYANKFLAQISKDHVDDTSKIPKPPLIQFLGVPESEFIIKPYNTRKIYSDDDLYLICSDGLSDMLSEEEIKNILSANGNVENCIDILLENALSKGGKDNITIILCKVVSKKTFI